MKKTTKEIALKAIIVSMNEVTVNLKTSAKNEDVIANSAAMKTLAEAYAIIAGSRADDENN